MKKLIKFVFGTLAVLVLLAVLLVAALPLWFGPVARPVANLVVPRLTQTDFSVGRLSLNPYTGRLEVDDVRLGNPTGYAEPQAFALGRLVVDVDLSTVLSDCIHVEELTLSDLFVSYLVGTNGVDNLTQIRANVTGDGDDPDAPEASEGSEASGPSQEAAATEGTAGTPAEEEADDDEGPSRRLVIDRLSVSGVKVKLQMITIPVPLPITLTDVGAKSGGVTLTELSAQVWEAILKGATSVGDGAAALGGLINAKAGELGDAIKAIDAKAAGKAAGDALKSASDSLQSTADTVNEGVKKTADSVKKILGL